jgi:hypothetical protein
MPIRKTANRPSAARRFWGFRFRLTIRPDGFFAEAAGENKKKERSWGMDYTQEDKKWLKAYLNKELRDYLRKIGALTAEENKDLRDWVASGNSVYDNSCLLYDDSGGPMDYITACRINTEMIEGRLGEATASSSSPS